MPQVALGEIRDARAVEPLTQTLKDKDKGVREAAAIALERVKMRPCDEALGVK
jgi:HEAT repeat protein